jgi:hypothetical protein
MHVVSASRRTDIPAFHSRWFMERIREGNAVVRAPFGGKLFHVSLVPADVIAIVFWTKNAAPLLQCLDELIDRGYCFTFLYTINNYPPFLEPNVPPLTHTMRVVENLAKIRTTSIVRWRYDTIVMSDQLNRAWHLENFRELCQLLAPHSRECIFSFCDYYRKTTRNMDRCVPGYRNPHAEECIKLSTGLAEIAREWGIEMKSCAHDFLVNGEITKARCIDPAHLASIIESNAKLSALQSLKKTPTREDCGCFASKDVGAYDTCGHGCAYCYANANPERALFNLNRIRHDDPCLDPNISERLGPAAITSASIRA